MHLKLNNIFLALAISLLFIACNGGQLKEVLHDSTITSTTVIDTSKTNTAGNEIKTIAPDTLSTDSRQFIDAAANDLTLQINMSNTAIKESTSEEIKNLGKTIVDQQTELFNKLKSISTEKNLEISSATNQSMQDVINLITAKTGKAFDNAYLNWVIQDSKATMKNFETAGGKLTDQTLQQFAVTSVSTIKQHLDAAEALKKKL